MLAALIALVATPIDAGAETSCRSRPDSSIASLRSCAREASSIASFDPACLGQVLEFCRTAEEFPALNRFARTATKPEDMYDAQTLERLLKLRESPKYSLGKEKLEQWQKVVFGGKAPLKIFPSGDHFPDTDIGLKTVFFDPAYVDELDSFGLGRGCLDFTIVHETMHYCYDYYVDRQPGKKSCGALSGYLLNDADVRNEDGSPKDPEEFRRSSALKHAQMDALAALVLKSKGQDPSIGLRCLNALYAKHGVKVPADEKAIHRTRVEAFGSFLIRLRSKGK